MKLNRPFLNNLAPWFTAFVIAATIGCYIRLYPLRGHIWSPTHEQATMLVVFNIKQSLLQEIHRQSPDMPMPVAMRQAEDKLNETLHLKSKEIRNAIENVNAQMARDLHTKEPVYLLESDPFYFYYLTQYIVDHGRIADKVKGSKYFNPLMKAPFGDWQPLTIHPYVGYVTYLTIKLFSPDIPLMHAIGYTPLVISALVLIPFFWICRMLTLGPLTSLSGALIMTLAPIYLKRSAFGWYDTDPYNLLFPFIMLGILIWGFQKKEIVRGIKAGIFLGLTVCLHALIWQGWGFMFMVSLACALAVAILGQFIIKDTQLRNQSLCLLGSSLITTVLAVSTVFGPQEFFILIKEGLGELTKFTGTGLELWPNLFIGVGELKKSTGKSLLDALGGWTILGLGINGLTLSLIQMLKNPRHPYTIAHGLIVLFLGATGIVTVGAERFAIFMLIPLSLLSVLCLESLMILIKKLFLSFPSWLNRIAPIAAITLFMFFTTAKGSVDITTTITPIFNAAWNQALLDIKDKTPKDSIINTWWSPGHFIKGIAHRRVPFDGASLDQGAVGYWISNILLSTDEKKAQGLTRMLNLSSNKGYEYLVSLGLKASQSVELLTSIASKSKNEAALFLKPLLKPANVDQLLTLTHGNNPHSYLLLYNELVDENLILKFTGGWNFAKVEKINDNPPLLTQVPRRNDPSFIDFLWDISGGPSKYSEALPILGEQGGFMLFKEKLAVDLQSMDATIDSPQFGRGKPLSVVYLNGSGVVEHLISGGQLNYSVLIYQQDGQKFARLMDRPLANSLLMKLFFFDGKGLRFFKPLTEAHDLTGRTQIKVFEVLWN